MICYASVAHVLAECSALVQSKYPERHNAALKVLYFQILRDRKLINEVLPWYSPVQPKPLYENSDVQAYWDIPVFAEQSDLRANRVDARVTNHRAKAVTTMEMSCPCIENRSKMMRRLSSMALLDGNLKHNTKDTLSGKSMLSWTCLGAGVWIW